MTGGGGTASIKRAFQVAPGETIQKDDVVTVVDDKLYRNREMKLSELPRFSPDVYYLPLGIENMSVHPIGGDSFIHIGMTATYIHIIRAEATAGGIQVIAQKSLPVFGSEGIYKLHFKPLTADTGILYYLEYNTSQWAFRMIRWPGEEELRVGLPYEIELYTYGTVAVESLSEQSFLVTWVCGKEPAKVLKSVSFAINRVYDTIEIMGTPLSVETNETLHDDFALSKLADQLFVASFWLKGATRGTIVNQLLQINQDGVPVAGVRTAVNTPNNNLVELRQLVLSPTKFVLINKLDTMLNYYTVFLEETDLLIGIIHQVSLTDPFFDAVKLSSDRILTAINAGSTTGALTLSILDTANPMVRSIASKVILSTVKGNHNKLQLVPMGNDIFVLGFNHVTEPGYNYTQAAMLRVTTEVIDVFTQQEQLINIWDKDAVAEVFRFSPIGTGGRFIAAGRGRLKIYRCGWSPMRFITSGIGEFKEATGDHGFIKRTMDVVRLTNGYIAIAYRERDTWHGKLSVFKPADGGYQPLLSHTFSYSHIDNPSIVELDPGTIAVQFKQRIVPAYDSKQLDRGEGIEEMKVMVATITESGLTNKMTSGVTYLAQLYVNSHFTKLDNGCLLHVGVTSGSQAVVAQVVKYQAQGTAMYSFGRYLALDYERGNVESIQLAGNKVAVHTFSCTILLEISSNGDLVAFERIYSELTNRKTLGFVSDGKGGAAQITINNSNNGLETTSYSSLNNGLYQTADTVARKKQAFAVKSKMTNFGGRAAFVYRARWESGRDASYDAPHQNLWLALLDIDMETDGDGTPPKDRFYPFPGAVDIVPVFIPLDHQSAFCVGTDEYGNQVYMLAYGDGESLSYGRPYLTPLGVASSAGNGGEHVEVTVRGISESETPLMPGAVYYNGRDGKLCLTAGGKKIGIAISEHELLVE
ncbi:hypothetical protein [Paenibacillus sp. NEAU-GSW1]|uniref:hypothetical protein n=1 Tax=Paenibacillus sp. NEAU-GSW1 TaxID=2682486 RepID=UPI001563E797|nr:hypothetical protein [Paenibacillus sp. NEAU-GSW1]